MKFAQTIAIVVFGTSFVASCHHCPKHTTPTEGVLPCHVVGKFANFSPGFEKVLEGSKSTINGSDIATQCCNEFKTNVAGQHCIPRIVEVCAVGANQCADDQEKKQCRDIQRASVDEQCLRESLQGFKDRIPVCAPMAIDKNGTHNANITYWEVTPGNFEKCPSD